MAFCLESAETIGPMDQRSPMLSRLQSFKFTELLALALYEIDSNELTYVEEYEGNE